MDTSSSRLWTPPHPAKASLCPPDGRANKETDFWQMLLRFLPWKPAPLPAKPLQKQPVPCKERVSGESSTAPAYKPRKFRSVPQSSQFSHQPFSPGKGLSLQLCPWVGASYDSPGVARSQHRCCSTGYINGTSCTSRTANPPVSLVEISIQRPPRMEGGKAKPSPDLQHGACPASCPAPPRVVSS